MNAIQLLKHQHQEMGRLFKDIERCSDDEVLEIRRLFAELADILAAHSEIEEQLFYPAVKQRQTEDMLKEFVQEHFEVKQILAQMLDLEAGSSEFILLLAQLKDVVLSHMKEEESDMFPKVQQLFEREDLVTLGEEMEHRFGEIIAGEPRFEVRGELDAPAQI
ncbi:MAG TPA: hemerythrin domain-containing protein [Myxococcales bacterium]|nr:hemerythrin domain-containing protein [Myxococcales bacterium]